MGWTCRRTQVIHHQLLLVSELDSNSFWTSGDSSTLLVMNFSSSRMLLRLSSLPAYFSASSVCLFWRSACAHPHHAHTLPRRLFVDLWQFGRGCAQL